MKIGIIVHSKTGNTRSVAELIKEQLIAKGHITNMDLVSAYNDDQMKQDAINLNNIPAIEGYDIIVLGAPVRGFSLSPVMKKYLSQIKSLEGIRVAVFVTQFFPFKSMGGNQAIEQFRTICKAKGGKIIDTGVVNWKNINRKKQIKELVQRMSNM